MVPTHVVSLLTCVPETSDGRNGMSNLVGLNSAKCNVLENRKEHRFVMFVLLPQFTIILADGQSFCSAMA